MDKTDVISALTDLLPVGTAHSLGVSHKVPSPENERYEGERRMFWVEQYV